MVLNHGEEHNPDIIGKKILRYESAASTNQLAKKMAQEGSPEGTIVFAEKQTAGRGRKNRIWHSPAGGLWFSVVLYPPLEPDEAMLVTMAASVSIAEVIKNNYGLEATIKWPNDVLIGNKKVAGVLTELHAEDKVLEYMVVGVGINVNNDIPTGLSETATALKLEMDKTIDLNDFFKEIIHGMDRIYSKVKEGEFGHIRDLWIANSDIIGRKVGLYENDSVVTGRVEGIDRKGRLLLNVEDEKAVITSGDIRLL